jgi:predicted secreted hydrolase
MRRFALLATLTLVLAGCGGPVLANPPAPHPPTAAGPSSTPPPADPQPVVLPRDDGPHGRLTEWWYDTGHLVSTDGRRFGFELVVFRAERGGFPVTWASHLALTDEGAGQFHYAQRAEIGPRVDRSPRDPAGTPTGFSFVMAGANATAPEGGSGGATSTSRAAAPGSPWTMAGGGGSDMLRAAAAGPEVAGDAVSAFGIDLRLTGSRPAVLHDTDGYVDFGPAGGSYYYSRTAMTANGTITLGDQVLRVTGDAWFDHQWGDFISVGAGGWDWFALNLGDGTDVMLSLVRAADGTHPLVYGTLVDPTGRTRTLGAGDATVTATDHWTSPATGATYPAGWVVTIPGDGLVIRLSPSVAQQELDTRPTTGVVYWEGSQRVTATRGGLALAGEAYVELTGYGPKR